MSNYIRYADLNVQSGILSARIEFHPGFNILSGENGTLKTKVLQALKTDRNIHLLDPSSPCRRQAISPKRNAQRRTFVQVFEQLRRNNTKLEALINERNIQDTGFEDYPGIGDLFYVVYDDYCKDGGNQKEKMELTESDFNSVIRRIFPYYKLYAVWNEAKGSPDIEIIKHGNLRVPLEGLSLGEQDILSLVTNIYSSRNRYDVFLIDEPEVHLNWHLEEKLFEFFDDYCDEHKRQMIVVSHSRVVFTKRFFPKTQFLYWNEMGKVEIGKDVTQEQRRRIAGDAIEIIQLGNIGKCTFFVEDDSQTVILEEISSLLQADISVSTCGNKSNVRSLFRLSKIDTTWGLAYFLEDGDNEGNPFPDEPNFIHLEKYCFENYLLNVNIVAKLLTKPETEVKELLLQSILENKDKIFRKNKFFEFLLEHLKAENLTPENLDKLDAAQILSTFLDKIDLSFREFVRNYIMQCQRDEVLKLVFPSNVIEIIETAHSTLTIVNS